MTEYIGAESSMKERQARRDKRSKLVEESLASLKTEDSNAEVSIAYLCITGRKE